MTPADQQLVARAAEYCVALMEGAAALCYRAGCRLSQDTFRRFEEEIPLENAYLYIDELILGTVARVFFFLHNAQMNRRRSDRCHTIYLSAEAEVQKSRIGGGGGGGDGGGGGGGGGDDGGCGGRGDGAALESGVTAKRQAVDVLPFVAPFMNDEEEITIRWASCGAWISTPRPPERPLVSLRPSLGDPNLLTHIALDMIVQQVHHKARLETASSCDVLVRGATVRPMTKGDDTTKALVGKVRRGNPKCSTKCRLVWAADFDVIENISWGALARMDFHSGMSWCLAVGCWRRS